MSHATIDDNLVDPCISTCAKGSVSTKMCPVPSVTQTVRFASTPFSSLAYTAGSMTDTGAAEVYGVHDRRIGSIRIIRIRRFFSIGCISIAAGIKMVA